MASFIVETYAARLTEVELAEVAGRARQSAADESASGATVAHLRSYHVPGDEMCLHVFEGPTREAVARVAALAGIDVARVIETMGTANHEIPWTPGLNGEEPCSSSQ